MLFKPEHEEVRDLLRGMLVQGVLDRKNSLPMPLPRHDTGCRGYLTPENPGSDYDIGDVYWDGSTSTLRVEIHNVECYCSVDLSTVSTRFTVQDLFTIFMGV